MFHVEHCGKLEVWFLRWGGMDPENVPRGTLWKTVFPVVLVFTKLVTVGVISHFDGQNKYKTGR
jgi:hypothetical protein